QISSRGQQSSFWQVPFSLSGARVEPGCSTPFFSPRVSCGPRWHVNLEFPRGAYPSADGDIWCNERLQDVDGQSTGECPPYLCPSCRDPLLSIHTDRSSSRTVSGRCVLNTDTRSCCRSLPCYRKFPIYGYPKSSAAKLSRALMKLSA